MVSYSATAILLFMAAVLSSLCMADNFLLSPESLDSGSAIEYGSYSLTMQDDCNLVLYDNGSPIWASNTADPAFGGCYCTMQSDGNLVVYEGSGVLPLWSSKTERAKGQYVLVLQPDRNLVIYGGAVWATHTNIPDNAGLGDITRGTKNATVPPVLVSSNV